MEKQQTLRRKVVGAPSSCAGRQAQKSLASQPRSGAPHRILDLRNQITGAGSRSAPAAPPGPVPDAADRPADEPRSRER
jgi:hypothetical protein